MKPKVPWVIRFLLAFGFAVLAARIVRNLAEPVWFLKLGAVGPDPYFDAAALAQIVLTLVLVFPLYYVADWLLKSRTLTILISFGALIGVLWFMASVW
jgi:hypothetical protein